MSDYPKFSIETIMHPVPKKVPPALSPDPLIQRNQGIELHPKAEGILQKSFIMGVLGNPGSGKSTLIQKLLTSEEFYGQKFERVLFIGPTVYKSLVQDDGNWKKTLDVNWIIKQIQLSLKWKCKSMLIIFDDVVSSLKGLTNDKRFIQLFYNRRHLLDDGVISLIVSGQKWNLVPTFIRGAYTSLILFSVAKPQVQSIGNQLPVAYSKRQLNQMVHSLSPHQFIYFNLENKDLNPNWCDLAILFMTTFSVVITLWEVRRLRDDATVQAKHK